MHAADKPLGKKSFPYLLILFLYTLTGFFILSLDLGKFQAAQIFVKIISSIIPSILPTAALTAVPQSVALVLSISWVMVAVIALCLILFVNWNEINFESFYTKTSSWLILGSVACIPVLIIFFAAHTPEDYGRYGKFIYGHFRDSIYFVIIYGTGLWISFSAGLFFIAFNIVYLYKKLRKVR